MPIDPNKTLDLSEQAKYALVQHLGIISIIIGMDCGNDINRMAKVVKDLGEILIESSEYILRDMLKKAETTH